MSEGLIGGLRTFFLGDNGRLHEVDRAQTVLFGPGPWLRASDVREALRSDETVEAVAESIDPRAFDPDADWPMGVWQTGEWHRACAQDRARNTARAVLRVLAGDPTDSEAAK